MSLILAFRRSLIPHIPFSQSLLTSPLPNPEYDTHGSKHTHTYAFPCHTLTKSVIVRLQAVAAFAVSAVASQWDRTGKPFNPLLGETYELIRYVHSAFYIYIKIYTLILIFPLSSILPPTERSRVSALCRSRYPIIPQLVLFMQRA